MMRTPWARPQLELALFGYTPTRPRCDGCEAIPAEPPDRTPYFATLTQDRRTGLWYCDPCAGARGLLDGPARAQAPPG